MRNSWKHLRRFTYLILFFFFVCLPVFASFFSSGYNLKVVASPPEAIDVNNFLIQNISGRSQILPLIGKDSDGSVFSFKVLTLPAAAAGTLYLNNIAVSINQVISPAQAKQLQFEVNTTFTGTTSFTFTVTDNEGLSDASPASFNIPVTNNGTLLVCTGGKLGTNILGAGGTFSTPYISARATVNCINNNSSVAAPPQNIGNAKPALTSYNYASTSGGLSPEGTYSFLKTMGTMATRNCIKTDWVASDHTGDGGYAMIVNGSPNSANFGKTFYNATSIAVCPNTLYEFSAYVINVLPGNHPAAVAGTEPNISFYINNQLVSTSGSIPYSNASTSFVPQWVKVGGLWYSGPNTSVNLRIDNATFVAGGNDLGLDDISMAICGPEITYPDISLTPKFCSYGVLPLKAEIKASVNTYASYIFQNSTDGGLSWTDMGSPASGSPVYNSGTGLYEYLAVYGDIPIDPSMNGYRYRLKVATDLNNLTGITCNISADKIITVSAFEKPLAGADIVGCNSSTTAKLVAAEAGETWSPVGGNPASASIDQNGNISAMTANGFYKFQLTNSSGCSDTINVTRDEISGAGSDVTICSPLSSYKLADAGTGYKWQKVAANPSDANIDSLTGAVTGMTADGIYHFILRSDYGGCTDEILLTRSSLALSSTQTNVNCFGESTGSIDLSVAGGTAPYSFLWGSGQTTEDLSALAAGTYTVTVTDSKGCSAIATITISQPSAVLAFSNSQTNVNCFGESTGAIDLSVTGGTAPYSYLWNSGQTTEDLSALAAGTYTISVTDSKGCTATDTITISQSAAVLTLNSNLTNVNCFGTSTGAIDLGVTGGTAPYSFLWNSGQTTEDISSLAAGTYTVTVSDSKGCTATTSITISQPAAVLALSSSLTNINCFGESTGSIDLSVAGGTAPYSFLWNSGQTTEDISSLAARAYSVRVTDFKGCTATASITISQPAAVLALSSTQTNINCFGESNGAVDLSVTGGTAPYTFLWGSGQTTEDLSALAAGTYTVVATDSKGCTATASITISQPAAVLALSSIQTNVNCFGESTGSIDLSVAGGTAPYSYSWNNSAISEDISSLAAGTYTVTVTDSKGCTATSSITISQPSAVLAFSNSQTNVNCFGESTGAIDLSVTGGTAPYSYSWSNSAISEDISSLAAGTYTVTVSDSKGCTATASITISQPVAVLAFSSSLTNINCFGESTGAIDLGVTGGTAPYSFLWGSGQTTEDISSLAAGTYTVTVTDSKGCTATDTITISQPAAVLALSSTQTNVNCFGESTGAIDLGVTGGTAPYSFLWNSGQTTEDLSALAAGTYTVTVTDSKGCTATTSITISQPAAVLALSSSQTNVNCFGASTGAIDLGVAGGTAPYSFLWGSGQTTEDISSLAAGTYTITVTDSKGCTATASITISQPAAVLALSSSQTNINCFGESTGVIDLGVTGGTAPYSYLWGSGQTTEDLSVLAAGTYSVTVTDSKGCTATASITISQPSAVLALNSSQTNVNCFGESTGAIDLSVVGGTAPYSFLWGSGQTTEDISSLAAGTYTVTVSDSKGCTATASITISQPVAVLALSSSLTNINCFGESTGSIDLGVTGGTAPYSFLWGSGQTTEDISSLAAGTYTITVTDSKGCTATASITISQPAAVLAFSSSQTNINCFGESTGAIDLSVTGGTAPYSYSWSNSAISEDISSLAAGSYTVTVTDSKGCTATASITISQPAAVLALSSSQTNVNCFGESTGAIDLGVTGGTAPYSFLWNSGQTTEDLSALAAGTYTVTVTDSKGCTATASITISQPAAVLALSSSQTNINCFGESTGVIDLGVTGGTAPYSYLWGSGQTTEDLSVLAAGTYSVTVTDSKGCTATASITISQPAAVLALSSTQTNINCFGESTGAIDLGVTGGTAPYSYLWGSGQTTEDLSVLAAGTYSVTVSDSKGCTATDTITISQSAAVFALSSTQTNINCFGESTGAIDLNVTGGTAPYLYSWTGGALTQDLSTLAAGTYTVVATDSKGCTATATITISQPAAVLALNSSQTNINCFGASTGAIDLSVAGGTAPYLYSWTGGATTQDLSALAAGTYTITVTDSKGCTATASITIIQPAAVLALSSSQTNINCFGESIGSIDLSVTGGTAPYSFLWNSGQTTEDISSLAAGTYSVTVSDSKGCTATDTITISQSAAVFALSSTQTNINCFGESTGAIDLNVTGGTAPYLYSWTDGATTQDLSALAAGTYTVVATDSKGCTVTASITISQPAAVFALSSTQTNINCFGASTGAIDLSVAGGTAPYLYSWTGGATTQDLSALAAGTYTITVTDSKGCTATASITIIQPAAVLALSSSQTNINCFGASTGSIDLSVTGGTAPYSYSWSNSAISEDISSLGAGAYTVTVTDSKGCTATDTITISQSAAVLALNSNQTNVNCFGESTGAIDLGVTGGTAPYSYSWGSGQTIEDISTLAAGTYTITVTDSKGCTATASITISQPAAVLALSSSQTNVNCFGESTGSIDLSVAGGTAPYSYSWGSGQTTEDISSLAAGTYTITVTDSKNCTATTSITISQSAAVLALISSQTNINCFGESAGAIDLGVAGGTAPYSFLWNSGQTTEDISSLAAGTYSVTVSDSKGCTATASITISQPSEVLALNSSQTNVNCFGESTGAIDLGVAGGTAPYSFLWNSGQTTEDISSLAAGTYIITVTDSKKCSKQLKVLISQPEPLSVSITVKDASCRILSDGGVSAIIKGGKAPYKIVWNGNKDLFSPELINVLPGKYSLLITDSNGCTIQSAAEIFNGNCAPLAKDDSFKINQDLLLPGDVSPNDSDPNNEKLLFSKLSDPKNGRIVFNPDGKFTFLPDSGFNGETSFSYQICNVSGLCQTANVLISVHAYTIVSLSPELSSVREGKKTSISARLLRPFKEDVIITVEYSGKALKEKDFLVLDNYQRLRIPKGSLSTTEKMTYAALIDAVEEGDEDIIVKIKTVSNPDVHIGNGAVVIINDIYPPPPNTDEPQGEIVNKDIAIDPLLSPNGDGSGNEFFTIQNIDSYPDNEVLIFNRWGNELFSVKGYNSGDKTFRGFANKGLLVNQDSPLVDGVYFYIVNTYKSEAGIRTKNTNKGYLILKR